MSPSPRWTAHLPPWTTYTLLALVVSIALFLRVSHFSTLPAGLWPDECANGIDAMNSMRTGEFQVYYPANFGREGLYVWLNAVSISLLGNTVAGLRAPRGVRIFPLGFVTNMHELTAVADLMVSKPGGLTSSECLARGLPMLILDPIPGQEERNAAFLLEGGAGWQAATLEGLDYKLGRLLAEPSRLAAMSRAASRLARPQACYRIAAALARP